MKDFEEEDYPIYIPEKKKTFNRSQLMQLKPLSMETSIKPMKSSSSPRMKIQEKLLNTPT
jgi:hypothetical protein